MEYLQCITLYTWNISSIYIKGVATEDSIFMGSDSARRNFSWQISRAPFHYNFFAETDFQFSQEVAEVILIGESKNPRGNQTLKTQRIINPNTYTWFPCCPNYWETRSRKLHGMISHDLLEAYGLGGPPTQ